MRATDGTITTFDAPGAGTGLFEGTIAGTINPAGAIAGYYCDAIFFSSCHGFVRAKGTLTSFDPPGSVNTFGFPFNNLVPVSINPKGNITGTYQDASFANHGFLRTAQGSITSGDPPNSIITLPASLNEAGAFTGRYYTPGNPFAQQHGFVRSK